MNEELITTVLEELQSHRTEASLTEHALGQALGHEFATVFHQPLEERSQRDGVLLQLLLEQTQQAQQGHQQSPAGAIAPLLKLLLKQKKQRSHHRNRHRKEKG